MKTIPSVDFWFRGEFLKARKAQVEAQKKRDAEAKIESIVIDADDLIFCDLCDIEIENDGELINLVDFGKKVVCDKCYQEVYSLSPITRRKLNEDGSLGPWVKMED